MALQRVVVAVLSPMQKSNTVSDARFTAGRGERCVQGTRNGHQLWYSLPVTTSTHRWNHVKHSDCQLGNFVLGCHVIPAAAHTR